MLMINKRRDELLRKMDSAPVGNLSKKELDEFNRQVGILKQEKGIDQQSEFSILTDESEMTPKENRLDLRINTASFERLPLIHLLGG